MLSKEPLNRLKKQVLSLKKIMKMKKPLGSKSRLNLLRHWQDSEKSKLQKKQLRSKLPSTSQQGLKPKLRQPRSVKRTHRSWLARLPLSNR